MQQTAAKSGKAKAPAKAASDDEADGAANSSARWRPNLKDFHAVKWWQGLQCCSIANHEAGVMLSINFIQTECRKRKAGGKGLRTGPGRMRSAAARQEPSAADGSIAQLQVLLCTFLSLCCLGTVCTCDRQSKDIGHSDWC